MFALASAFCLRQVVLWCFTAVFVGPNNCCYASTAITNIDRVALQLHANVFLKRVLKYEQSFIVLVVKKIPV